MKEERSLHFWGKKRTQQQENEAEQRRLDPVMRALKALHSVTAPESVQSEELERQRRSQEILGRLTANFSGMSWEEFDLNGMPAAWTRPQRPHRRRRAVLYCHGGGYTSGNLGYARILSSKMVQVTGLDVLSFGYRLAPEHPHPAAVEDAVAAWDHLMYLGYGARDVVILGDSAGGNLALVLCQQLQRQGRMLPGALILLSPWTDMTMSGSSYSERAAIDPMLTPEYIQTVREAYAPGKDYRAPELSPLFGSFEGFPPTLIQVGTHELLFSDAQSLHERMREALIPCKLEVWEDMWHVFQMFPMKKASQAMEAVAGFLLEYL